MWWMGVAFLVLLAICAVAAVVACFLIGWLVSSIRGMRSDQRAEMERFRARTDHVVNHVMTLGEKVDAAHAATSEMNRLLRGTKPAGRGSRPDM